MPLCETVRVTPHPGLFLSQLELPEIDKTDLLYLFACSLRWRDHADTTAGWDLVKGLRSYSDSVRLLAADLLVRSEIETPPSRNIREFTLLGQQITKPLIQLETKEEMITPYGLELCENCITCKLTKPGWFCHLSREGQKSLSQSSHITAYPGGALLFVEGQTPRGAFIVCSGRVKISTTSREGKVLILKIAGPGSVLGLSAVIAGEPFEMTAETSMPCQVNFVEREGLLRLLRSDPQAGLHATEVLSREFQSAYRDIHDLILARSSAGKLARLLLSWTPDAGHESLELRVRSGATHEEMAQMIGASRETVTRLLSDLKKKELIRLEGSTLVIRNRGALEDMAA